MTTLAQMRSKVARDHGWHEDDDGDRIDEVLNERFGQAAVEMYAALERAQKLLDRLARPAFTPSPTASEIRNTWAEAIGAELDARNALSKARAQ